MIRSCPGLISLESGCRGGWEAGGECIGEMTPLEKCSKRVVLICGGGVILSAVCGVEGQVHVTRHYYMFVVGVSPSCFIEQRFVESICFCTFRFRARWPVRSNYA